MAPSPTASPRPPNALRPSAASKASTSTPAVPSPVSRPKAPAPRSSKTSRAWAKSSRSSSAPSACPSPSRRVWVPTPGALLIARAALENPCVFSFSKGDPCDLAERHLDLELRYRALAQTFSRLTPEEATVLTFRKHLFRYFKGLPGANALRGRLMDLHTVADLRAAIAAFRQ